jgi:hypothetical protein
MPSPAFLLCAVLAVAANAFAAQWKPAGEPDQGSVEFGRNSLASGMICRGVDFRPEMPYKGGHDRYRLRNLQLPVGPCAAC